MATVKGSRILSGLQWLWGLGFFCVSFFLLFFHCFRLFIIHSQKLLSFTATLNLKYKTLVLFVVMVLSEVIFFIVAGMGSCFRFFAEKTVLTIWKCSHYCQASPTRCKSLFCPSPHPTSEEPGSAQWVERWRSWDSWPQLTQGSVHHTEHIELGKEGKGDIWSDDVCLSVSLLFMMELCCPGGV